MASGRGSVEQKYSHATKSFDLRVRDVVIAALLVTASTVIFVGPAIGGALGASWAAVLGVSISGISVVTGIIVHKRLDGSFGTGIPVMLAAVAAAVVCCTGVSLATRSSAADFVVGAFRPALQCWVGLASAVTAALFGAGKGQLNVETAVIRRWTVGISGTAVVFLLMICTALGGPLGALVIPMGFYGFYFAPEIKSKPVESPDGRSSAYAGTRGFLDNINSSLYIQGPHGYRQRVRLGLRGSVKWSPDSQKVAVVETRESGSSLVVADITRRSRGCGYGADFTKNLEHKEGAAEEPVGKLDWCWAGPNAIEVIAGPEEADEETGELRVAAKHKAVFGIIERAGKIEVNETGAKAGVQATKSK